MCVDVYTYVYRYMHICIYIYMYVCVCVINSEILTHIYTHFSVIYILTVGLKKNPKNFLV